MLTIKLLWFIKGQKVKAYSSNFCFIKGWKVTSGTYVLPGVRRDWWRGRRTYVSSPSCVAWTHQGSATAGPQSWPQGWSHCAGENKSTQLQGAMRCLIEWLTNIPPQGNLIGLCKEASCLLRVESSQLPSPPPTDLFWPPHRSLAEKTKGFSS